VDHVTVVVSDIEMGAGGPTDDFPGTAWLGELLLGYTEGPFRDVAVTLVFNGDTFDLLKTSLDGIWPTHVDATVGLGKLERIMKAHGHFFDAVATFLRTGPAERRVAFLQGNHDQDIAFGELQQRIVSRLAPPDGDAVTFPGLSLRMGDVHIEHGSQQDPMFAVEPDAPFIERDGKRLLNLPWGSVALLEVAIPLTPLLYHHDRLKPRDQLLELMPEMRDLLLGAFWRYWTRDYWQEYFAEEDPLKRVSWTMLKEIVYQFGSRSMDVSVGRAYRRLVAQSDDIALAVIGHQHDAAWWTVGTKRVLRTSAFRNEFALLDGGHSQQLLPKVYAEIYSHAGKALRSHLIDVDGPPPPADSVPASIFDVTEDLKAALRHGQLAESVDRDRAEQAQQEAREAASRGTSEPSHELWRSLRRALSRH
jgi:UDP-2,3-diacylglucosamine pyrophosphatase LpxH